MNSIHNVNQYLGDYCVHCFRLYCPFAVSLIYGLILFRQAAGGRDIILHDDFFIFILPADEETMDRKKELILTLTRWIDDNIHLPLKIEQVAERSGYSRWHLQRMFYDVMQQSLGKYIREKKLMRAAEDLRTGDETVMEISLRYGFESQQSFTRSFSGKYQVPPATFRRCITQEPQPSGLCQIAEPAGD